MKKFLFFALLLLARGSSAFAQCSTPAPITGSHFLCPSSYTTTLSDATSGGTWSTGDGCISVGATSGVVTGTCGGTATITYTVPGGCYVTFNIGDAAITGPAAVCSLSTATMSDVFGGGTWSTASTAITITSGGGIVSVASGLLATTAATISYAPPSFTGCPTITTNIVVDLPPSITSLVSSPSGPSICENSPISFTTTLTTGTGVAPYTYNWWYDHLGSYYSFASNSGVTGTTSTGYQMGGITPSEAGTYYGNVVDHYGCVSPTYTGPTISVTPAPTVYTVSYHTPSHTPGCYLDLSGTDNGVNYVYGIDGVMNVGSFTGTGSAPPPFPTDGTHEGNYFVVARDPISHCGAIMNPELPVCTGCRLANPYLGVGATPTVEPLTLLPNPNNGNFNLSGSAGFLSGVKMVRSEIIDITGHMILAKDVPVTDGSISQSIQLPGDIANGTYFVKLSTGTQSQVLRLSLNR